MRRYSRENCVGLSYPTWKAAFAGRHALRQHQCARLLQPQLLLVLHGRHRSRGLEALVEHGRPHARELGQLGDAQRLGVVALQPDDGAIDAMGRAVRGQPLAQVRAVGAAQQPVRQLAGGERCEDRNVHGAIEQAYDACGGIQQIRIGGGELYRRGDAVRVGIVRCRFGGQRRQQGEIKIDPDAQVGQGRTGLDYAGCDRQIGSDEHRMRSAVVECAPPHDQLLCALHDDAQRRRVQRELARRRRRRPRAAGPVRGRESRFREYRRAAHAAPLDELDPG